MIEQFQFLTIPNIEKPNPMPPEILRLLHNSVKLYKEKKVKQDLYNLIDIFLEQTKYLVDLDYEKVAFVPIYDKKVELSLIPTIKNNILLNFGSIDSFPTYNVNALYSILFYAYGYYLGIINDNMKKSYLNHVANIYFGMFLKLFGKSHSLLSLDDWKFEAIRYFITLHVYKRFGQFENVKKMYTGKIMRDFSLKYVDKYNGIKVEDDRLENIIDLFTVLSNYDIIKMNKNIYVHRIYNTLGYHGVIMFDNWYRFCAQIFATVYPTRLYSSFVKQFNKPSYSKVLDMLHGKAKNLDYLDPQFIMKGEF